MPTYWFECDKGHLSEEAFSIASCPRSIVCACGRSARKVMAPVSILRTDSGFGDDDGDIQALYDQREENEWAVAAGREVQRKGSKNRSSDPTSPRKFETEKKREQFKATGKVPEQFAHVTQ